MFKKVCQQGLFNFCWKNSFFGGICFLHGFELVVDSLQMICDFSHITITKWSEALKKVFRRNVVFLTLFELNVNKRVVESYLWDHFVVKDGLENVLVWMFWVPQRKLIDKTNVADIEYVLEINLGEDTDGRMFLLLENANFFLLWWAFNLL